MRWTLKDREDVKMQKVDGEGSLGGKQRQSKMSEVGNCAAYSIWLSQEFSFCLIKVKFGCGC